MDVTIKFLPTPTDPMGTVERVTTPPNGRGGVEHWRAGFDSVGPDMMGLRLERGEWRDGRWRPMGGYDCLVAVAYTAEEYMSYLDKHVASITIDGTSYWTNGALGGDTADRSQCPS